MDFSEFQRQALQSVAITDKGVAALAHRSLGLVGEAGIIANAMKKTIRDHNGSLTDEDITFLSEKVGDVLYYAAVLAAYADLDLADVAKEQIKKSKAFTANRKIS